MTEVWYRIDSNHDGGLWVQKYTVAKHTPKGVRLVNGMFVLNPEGGKKRFAHPTFTEALAAFAERKRRYIRILTARLSQAQDDLEKVYDPYTWTGTERLGERALLKP